MPKSARHALPKLCLPLLVTLCVPFLPGTCFGSLPAQVSEAEHSPEAATAKHRNRPPNVVLIMADDLGASDLACYGADLHETPHLDRLAAENVQFLTAYAMSVCSPSRAALMTGKHAARLRMTIWSEGSLRGPTDQKLLQAESRHDLPLSEVTLAEYFRSAGYLTALVGKWHLGGPGHFPETQGFDVNIGGNHWGAPQTYFWPWRGTKRYGGEFRYVPHLEFGQPGDYLTERLTEEALRVISRAGNQPFFLCLTHFTPHTPLEAREADIRYFQDKLRPEFNHQNAVYAAMVRSLDDSVGRVLQHLDEHDLTRNTVVIFCSDNGGSIGIDRLSGLTVPSSCNLPLRSGKGSLYEGGIRVPLIIRWPGLTGQGVQCSEPVILMDLFHTLKRLIPPAAVREARTAANNGSAVEPAQQPAEAQDPDPADGLDLTQLLQQPDLPLNRDALYFHYPHYYDTTTPVSAIRTRRWKLLQYLEDGRLELYDLSSDLGESQNLADQHPDVASALRQQLESWRRSVDAAMPSPNVAFRSAKGSSSQ